MNTPNKLTIFRVILTPVFLALMLIGQIKYHYFIALVIFAVASLTDLIDGNMARKNQQVTTFGKFLDPLADKILTTAALLCFMQLKLCSIWVVMIVITREFIVTSVRLIAVGEGKVIAANMWGKVKTSFQMVAMVFVILCLSVQEFGFFGQFPLATVSHVLMWITAVVTVISGVKYVVDNRAIITSTK